MNDNNTSKELANDSAIVDESVASKETVSSEAGENVSLKEINEYLGKNYKDKGSALKSLKDTFSFVGKKVEKSAEVESSDVKSKSGGDDFARRIKEMKEQLFYSENPDYKPYKGLISKMGENPADVVGLPEFKDVFDKASSFDKNQTKKNVLESNPRIGVVRNKLKEATEAAGGRDYNTASKLATDAVMEAYDMGE